MGLPENIRNGILVCQAISWLGFGVLPLFEPTHQVLWTGVKAYIPGIAMYVLGYYIQRSMNQISAILKKSSNEKNKDANEAVERKLQSSVYRVLVVSIFVASVLMISATMDLIFADHWQFVVYPSVSDMVRSSALQHRLLLQCQSLTDQHLVSNHHSQRSGLCFALSVSY